MPQRAATHVITQNGEKIVLEKESEVITAYVYNALDLHRIQSLDGVLHAKQVFNEVYRFRVDPNKLEAIMQAIRGGFQIVCHHAYRPVGTSNTRYYITNKITIKFKSKVSVEQINDLMLEMGLRYVRHYDTAAYLMQVTASSGMNPIKLTAKINQHKRLIAYAEPNLVSRFIRGMVPADSKFVEQWHLQSCEAPELLADADIGATQAWDITRGSREVVIAILDDGFDLAHPDLSGDGKIVHPRDFVTGGNKPLPDENSYHGTPCAGIAIAELNGDGVVGVAPDCAFMPVRIPFGADANLLYEIFDYVGKRAHIISCSWGPPPVNAPLHQLVYDKIADLAAHGGPDGKGCVIVFAAHNYNAPLKDLHNTNGIRYLIGNRIYQHNDPIWNGNATHPDVMAVSACTSMNRKAAYSNWGEQISVCAPSNNYHPLDYSLKLQGRGLCTTDNFFGGAYLSPNSRYTTNFGGTSASAPIVAGVAGLVKSVNPQLTARQIRQIIEQTADKIVDNEPDMINANQKGTYNQNGHAEWFGYGRVNAYQAVLAAQQQLQQLAPPPYQHTQILEGQVSTNKNNETFNISVPENKKIRLQLSATDTEQEKNTNFDLYLKKNQPPTPTDYDHRATSLDANEQIDLNAAEAGDYYVLIQAVQGEGRFELRVSIE